MYFFRRALSLAGLALGCAASFGFTDCASGGAGLQCTAACSSKLEAAGAFEIPEEATDLTVELCVGSDCASSNLVANDAGGFICSGAVVCKGVAGTFTMSRLGDLIAEPEVGDVVVATVKPQSGAPLLEESVSITAVSESEVCGNACNSATVTW